jgi:type IV pilus assembly protein PilE
VRQQHQQYSSGFTLIEVMIVVVIIAIITAIAYPSYRSNVDRSRRSDVRAILSENAQFIEAFNTVNNRYDQDVNGVAIALPATTQVSPRNAVGNNIMYNIAFQAAPTAAAFTLQAVPANLMVNDGCGTYTINNLGQTGNLNLIAPWTTQLCWSK